jgi:hypothetical protein
MAMEYCIIEEFDGNKWNIWKKKKKKKVHGLMEGCMWEVQETY